MRILIVLTSHDRLGDTGKKTGFWFDEFATPYYIFKDTGIVLTLASPEGGLPPVDPRSEWPEAETAATIRFQRDLTHKQSWRTPGCCRAFRPATMMPPSIQVATACCGISPMTRIQSH